MTPDELKFRAESEEKTVEAIKNFFKGMLEDLKQSAKADFEMKSEMHQKQMATSQKMFSKGKKNTRQPGE